MAQLDVTVKEIGISQTDARLNKLAQTADRAEASANRVGRSFGKIPFGQIGYQVQDLTTQLQMGTSASVAIGQQGSQLAGAFGPGGAVIGAGIGAITSMFQEVEAFQIEIKDNSNGSIYIAYIEKQLPKNTNLEFVVRDNGEVTNINVNSIENL